MTAASTPPVAPINDVDTPNTPNSPALAAVSKAGRLCLDTARADLAAAADAIDGWYARQSNERRSYVGDGHETIRLIDAAARELYRFRAALVREIRADEDGRAAQADRMIAEFKALRVGGAAAPRDGGTA